MIKAIVAVGGLVCAAVAAFLAYAATRPSAFHVERSATMNASASAIFPFVNVLRRWQAWSPWDRIDPDMKRTYEGADSGVGAAYSWAGDGNIGEGKMTITESVPDERVVMKLEFFKPMAGVSTARLTFAPEGGGTRVTWSMDGTNGFAAKVFTVFMDMDAMIGGNFEQGLASLKSIVEAAPEK